MTAAPEPAEDATPDEPIEAATSSEDYAGQVSTDGPPENPAG